MLLMASVTTLLVLALAATIYINAQHYRALSRSLNHAYNVDRDVAELVAAMGRAEAMHQNYMLSGDEALLATYYALLPQISHRADALVAAVSNDPAQRARARIIRTRVMDRRDALSQQMKAFRQGGLAATSAMLKQQPDVRHPLDLHLLVDGMRRTEAKRITAITAQRARIVKLTIWLTGAGLLACLVLLWRATTLAIREQRIRMQSEKDIVNANADLATLLDESQRLADQLTRLADLGEMLQSCRKLSEALAVIGSSMPDVLPESAGAIQLLNPSRNLVETSAAWGTPALAMESVFAPDDCLALRRGHAYPASGNHAAVHCQHLRGTPVEAASIPHLCVPLINQGETLGVLHVQLPAPLTADMRRLIVTIGEHMALALGNLRMQETLRMQSIRDPLTGLFNRRYLEASLTRELLRAQRSGEPLALLMLDIDHFKRFNDTYGHEAGDTLLGQLAANLRRAIRAEEIACRFGGEEFTVILPDTTRDVALRRAEDIRKSVASMDVRHHDETLGPITCSVGVACFPQHGIDAGQLMRAADAALYEAKRAGRNRTEVAAGH